MAFSSWTTAEFSVGYPITSTFLQKYINNIKVAKYTYAKGVKLNHVPNGDFTIWTDGLPDQWDCSTLEGGVIAASTVSFLGQYSVMISHDGTTRSGGSITSDYIPCTTSVGCNATYNVYSYIRGDGNEAQLHALYYDTALTLLHSSKIATNSTYTNSSWHLMNNPTAVVYAGAKWLRFKIMNSTLISATKEGDILVGYIVKSG